MVAHQAAAGIQPEQQLARTPVLAIQPEQRECTGRLGIRAHAKHERGADEVLERLALPDERVGYELGADDRDGELGASHPLQRSEQTPPDRVFEQTPALVEGEELQAVPLAPHELRREHRDQPHDLLPHALGLRVLLSPRPRLGARQVTDTQVGDLALSDWREAHLGVGEAKLREA